MSSAMMAAALLNVPSELMPGLAGAVLHHAFVLLDEHGEVVHVSNVARVQLAS